MAVPHLLRCVYELASGQTTSVAMRTSSIVPKTPRRLVRTAVLCAVLWISHALGAELKTIAILDFVDDQHELSPATVEYQRLRAIRDQLQDEFGNNQLYRVVDLGPATALMK